MTKYVSVEVRQLTLGDLIGKLEAVKNLSSSSEHPLYVQFDFEILHPTTLTSYRGLYRDLAVEFTSDGREPTIEEFLDVLKSAVGRKFEGYKGGEHTATNNTLLWAANYGHTGETAIVDVHYDGYSTVRLMTAIKEDEGF